MMVSHVARVIDLTSVALIFSTRAGNGLVLQNPKCELRAFCLSSAASAAHHPNVRRPSLHEPFSMIPLRPLPGGKYAAPPCG